MEIYKKKHMHVLQHENMELMISFIHVLFIDLTPYEFVKLVMCHALISHFEYYKTCIKTIVQQNNCSKH